MTLLKQQARAEGLSLLLWGLAFGAFVLWSITLWKSLMASDAMGEVMAMLDSLPPALKAMVGGTSLTTIVGWTQAYAFGSWILIPYMVFTGLFAASLIAREMDRRTIEFLLSLPASRTELLLSRWVGMALALGVLQLLHLAAALAGVLLVGEAPNYGGFALAELNLWLLLLALGTLFLLLSLFIDDYGRAVGATLGLGFALFFIHVGSEGQGGAAERLRDLLPLAQFRPEAPMVEGVVPGGALLYLAVMTLAALLLSLFLFQRKEIAV